MMGRDHRMRCEVCQQLATWAWHFSVLPEYYHSFTFRGYFSLRPKTHILCFNPSFRQRCPLPSKTRRGRGRNLIVKTVPDAISPFITPQSPRTPTQALLVLISSWCRTRQGPRSRNSSSAVREKEFKHMLKLESKGKSLRKFMGKAKTRESNDKEPRQEWKALSGGIQFYTIL